MLTASGWVIQNKNDFNLNAGPGVAIREYQTDIGPADYVLFIDKKPAGIIEAKREEEGLHLLTVEDQSTNYASSKLKYLNNDPLPFVYESIGEVTRFTDYRDPKPRSREIFSFHRPETLSNRLKQKSLRARLLELPELNTEGLRECQTEAINNLEESFKNNKPRSLIQMATGSGKTFTAITFVYRLLKYAGAKRILFLVDTKNLGEQAEQEFMAYQPNDDNRMFKELYNVQRLSSGYVAKDNQVYISTIQRFYSILKGRELDEKLEEENPAERKAWEKQIEPVVYNEKIPIEFFDFIIIDECHRSIYNLWQQVLDYFDSFLIGLTATPDNRTFAFFNQNIVSEYSHEQAVADGVNVGYDVFLIETQIGRHGGAIWKGNYIESRQKLSRKKRWQQLDEDYAYTAKQLDNEIVNPNQIRTVIRAFRDNLPAIFPGRSEVPKTLIFAKSDSHADDIIQIVREEFNEENKFCKKITYSVDNPKSTLQNFRNEYFPRIAVTVDMIATGTDVKPLECLLFMRDVKSRNYFEQMKGRGTRTISLDDLKKVTPSASYSKDHFVIIDAIGVTKSLKTDSRPLDKQPSTPLKDLLFAVAVGNEDEALFTTLASRLSRLDKQITEKESALIADKAGKPVKQMVRELLNAFDPDAIDQRKNEIMQEENSDEAAAEEKAKKELISIASSTFNGSLNELIEGIRKIHEQIIDNVNPDTVITQGWSGTLEERSKQIIKDFKEWIEAHKEEITALQIFYNRPQRRREITFKMLKEVLDILKAEKPALAPIAVWRAYEQVEKAPASPAKELTALVSLIRNISGIDKTLTPYNETVDKNFRDWIFKKNAGRHNRFNDEQMAWLNMIKEQIKVSYHIERDDFDLNPFNARGGLGKMWELFGDETDNIINELNESVAA